MDGIISGVYFFGSLGDGFKVYPYSQHAYTSYSPFYNNSAKNYKLQVVKRNNEIVYTFVRYGILTSLVDGRTGSCFGLSIVFENYYFNSFEQFLSKICTQIFDAIIKEGKLLQKDSNGIIGFVSFDLKSLSHTLNEWIKLIKTVISEKYLSYLSGLNEIPDNSNQDLVCLSDKSSDSVILEKLKNTGGVILSPDFPIIIKTEKDLLSEKIQILEALLQEKEILAKAKITELEDLLSKSKLEQEISNSQLQSQITNFKNENINTDKQSTSNRNNKEAPEKDISLKTKNKDDSQPSRKIITKLSTYWPLLIGISVIIAIVLILCFFKIAF
jgi:hypothetical protein